METLSHSSTSAFKNCRKKYQYSYIDNLKLKEAPVYFSIGSASHIALAEHYDKESENICIAKINNYFMDHEPESNDIKEYSEWQNACDLTIELFKRYIREYQEEPFEVINTELKFIVPIVNPETNCKSKNFNFFGIVDMLVKENGLYWIVEHKTTSALSNQYKKKLTLDNQCIAYIEAIERFLNIKIQGVIYNVIVKSLPVKPKLLKNGSLSIAKNQNTTLELYLEALSENNLLPNHYSEHLDWLRSNRKEYFYREYLTFPKENIQEWREELWDLQKNIREAELKNQYYKNTDNCIGFGVCPYFDICTAIDKQSIIESSYKIADNDIKNIEEAK